MMKVLIVDDDNLVRKGLISLMPWQKFGMEVVGEANNGQKALEVLEREAVDVLITDLAMPVMSGIELMRIVRSQYPEIHIVVLTLHQDFDYVQEALRLDAIDYIAKVELEKDQIDEVLGRVVHRIHKKMKRLRPDPQGGQGEPIHTEMEEVWAVISMDKQPLHEALIADRLPKHVTFTEAERYIWLVTSKEADDQSLHQELMSIASAVQSGVVLKLCHVKGWTWNEIQRWVRAFYEKELFYLYHPDHMSMTMCMCKELQQNPGIELTDINLLEGLCQSTEWLYNDMLFKKFIRDMKLLRLPQTKLIGLFYSFVNDWNSIFAQTNLGRITFIEPVNYWITLESWLSEVRKTVRLSAEKTNYSQEIMNCILRAEQIIRSELSQPLTAGKVSKRLNMSRSYFSQCFKEIIGSTFNDYLKLVRMGNAKHYLMYTNKTIQWISIHSGYTDDKYFSRTFREHTGMLPSEFRRRKRADS